MPSQLLQLNISLLCFNNRKTKLYLDHTSLAQMICDSSSHQRHSQPKTKHTDFAFTRKPWQRVTEFIVYKRQYPNLHTNNESRKRFMWTKPSIKTFRQPTDMKIIMPNVMVSSYLPQRTEIPIIVRWQRYPILNEYMSSSNHTIPTLDGSITLHIQSSSLSSSLLSRSFTPNTPSKIYTCQTCALLEHFVMHKQSLILCVPCVKYVIR